MYPAKKKARVYDLAADTLLEHVAQYAHQIGLPDGAAITVLAYFLFAKDDFKDKISAYYDMARASQIVQMFNEIYEKPTQDKTKEYFQEPLNLVLWDRYLLDQSEGLRTLVREVGGPWWTPILTLLIFKNPNLIR